ncbi:MAG: NBR1-Ig-like domain-containing protein [Chloroflexi bacterium]|nr:NBR1-Ig-like domain-containing protein [Chloroflexota bacterium]
MTKKHYSLIAAIMLAASLAACNLPASRQDQETPQPSTSVFPSNSPKDTPNPSPSEQTRPPQTADSTSTATETAFETKAATSSVSSSADPTPQVRCDRAAPGNPLDITMPDDTHVGPGEEFSKTWRLLNTGECSWTEGYSLVWFSGQKFDATLKKPLSEVVAPGQSLDVTVDMQAPEKPGVYQSNWKLENESGELFGLGPYGDAPFWVRIQVVATGTPPILPSLVPSPVPSFVPTEAPSPIPTSISTSIPTSAPTAAPSPLPSPIVSSTPEATAAGQATLQPGNNFDLDKGQVGQGDTGDVRYALGEEQGYHLNPLNGARLASFAAISPSPAVCQTAALSSAPVSLDLASTGAYACYQTRSGFPGWLRLDQLNPEDGTLTITFETWSLP